MSLSGLSAIFVGSKTESVCVLNQTAARCAACAIDWKKCVTTTHANKSPRTETIDLDEIKDLSEESEEKSEKPGRRGKSSFVSVSDLTLIGVRIRIRIRREASQETEGWIGCWTVDSASSDRFFAASSGSAGGPTARTQDGEGAEGVCGGEDHGTGEEADGGGYAKR